MAAGEASLRLYNLTADPLEADNLALQLLKTGSGSELKDPSELTEKQRALRGILDSISARLDAIRSSKPPIQNITLQLHLSKWKKTAVAGNCSADPQIPSQDCKFLHPWISDVSVVIVIFSFIVIAVFLFSVERGPVDRGPHICGGGHE